MGKKLLIVDFRAKGFLRYADNIGIELKKKNPDLRIIGCYLQKNNEESINLLSFDFIFCANDYSLNVSKIFDIYKPDAILVFAHRFFDYLFTIEAHKRGIIVFNFQHGLYQPNTTVSSFTISKFPKLLKKQSEKIRLYTLCLYRISDNRMLYFLKYSFHLLRGNSLYELMEKYFNKVSSADISFIFGHYWIDYYQKLYREKHSKFVIIGYPELESPSCSIEESLFSRNKPVICYIAQTAVEDATASLSDMQKIFDRMEKLIENYNILIKYHPRSDISLYKQFFQNKYDGLVSVWNKKEFPIADAYLGHESTLLGKSLFLTNKVVISLITDSRHNPFEQYTKYVCKTTDDMKSMFETVFYEKKELNINNELDSFIYFNQNGSLVETASIIDKSLNYENS